ncbi:MAG: CPBP family intramembrane glutamic endopeptidase [Guyparkeria sp.]
MPTVSHLLAALAASLAVIAVAHTANWITVAGTLALVPLLAAAGISVRLRRVPPAVAMLVLSLGIILTLHLWPGFASPLVWKDRVFCAGCLPHSLYLSVDQALLVAAWLPLVVGTWRIATPAPLLGASMATVTAAITLGIATGLFRWQPGWPDLRLLGLFAATNLITVAAEEVLFRGLLQRHILHRLGAVHAWWLTAVTFGLAHLPFGAEFAAVATVAGLGYGYVAWQSGSLWPAIGLHWAINLLHFSLFSYPMLA